jgi:hypothetical protein
MILPRRWAAAWSAITLALVASPILAQQAPPTVWIRLEALPAEMKMTARESFDGVPPRFVLLTDGSVFVGGRREVLRGFLDKTEMQSLSTQIDLALRALGKGATPPNTLTTGDGPATFRFSVLAGTPLQIVIMGDLQAPASVKTPTSQLTDFIRRVANFRHPSLKPWEPEQFAMIAKEKTLPGGCRTTKGLPAIDLAAETVVAASVTYGFSTGPDVAQVCDGVKRYAIVFRPLIPGER